MPTLQFKGRNIIWNHHLTVPYHTLDEVPANSYNPAKGEGNIIVEGDNLTALKALLPQYAGKVKCIYIDPPYNTGNEGWVYNDKVNSPLINDWLGKTVGTDDLTRHDKWLCMMVPRLKLLKELLAPDGGIFISIDDNELGNLRLICNEIFKEENFIAVMPRITKKAGKTTGNVAKNTDYVLVYKGEANLELETNTVALENYDEEDEYVDERGNFKLSQTLDYGSIQYSPSLDYEIELDGEIFRPGGVSKKEMLARQKLNPKSDWCWRWSKELFEFGLEKGFVSVKQSRNGKRIYTKTYANATIKKNGASYFVDTVERTKKVTTLEFIENQYSNDNSRKEIERLFGSKVFEYSKPPSLVKKILFLATEPNSIILDSFAGSGTTGQAVLELNKEDGGNRKFILVQMTEASDAEPDKNIARDITAERIKRAITKYDLNSGFAYYKLGTAIDAETLLQGNLPTYEQFAKYVFYLCTGQHHSKPKEIKPKDYFVGNAGNTAIYLIYEQDFEKLTQLALNLSLAEKFRKASANKPIVVYAPACFLDEEYLQDFNMQFVSIPYNLFQKNEQP